MNEKFLDKEFSLDDFKKEVDRLKKQEEETLRDDGIRKTVHFKDVNADELNEADQKIYQKLLIKKLTVDELRAYQATLYESGNVSQKNFSAYIGNKLFIQMYKDK